MSLKPHLKLALVLAVFLACTVGSARAQVAQSANEKTSPFSIGLGLSTFPALSQAIFLAARCGLVIHQPMCLGFCTESASKARRAI